MLKEFAFTPQVFDPTAGPANSRWRECIQAIGVRLFTQPATPVVVAGLHSGSSGCSWEQVTAQTIQGIKDKNLRVDAQHLFTQVANVLVGRPACCDWPGDDEPGWGKEAADSHAQEPLHQIVVQYAESVPSSAPVASLAGALSPTFWAPLQDENAPPITLAGDVSRMRTVLVHSECLVLSAPYESTTDFAIECIRQAVQRPAGFALPIIHVHQVHSNPNNPGTRVAWLRRLIGPLANRGLVHWWFWPEDQMYRERVLLGGKLAQMGGGETKFAVRSGVSMTHVWGEGNPADAEPTTYSLLSAAQAKRHADQLKSRASKLKLAPVAL